MKIAIAWTLLLAVGALDAGSAAAGTLKCGGAECKGSFAGADYASSKCQPPQEPTLNLATAEAYNESVKAGEAYVKRVSTYFSCLTDEANADLKDVGVAINSTVKKLQDADRAKLDKMQVQLKNAEEKLRVAEDRLRTQPAPTSPPPAAPAAKR